MLYTATLTRNPDSWDANLNLGTHLVDAGRAVELAPADPEFRATIGRALADAGRAAEARTHLEKALRLAPGHPGASEVLERLGR